MVFCLVPFWTRQNLRRMVESIGCFSSIAVVQVACIPAWDGSRHCLHLRRDRAACRGDPSPYASGYPYLISTASGAWHRMGPWRKTGVQEADSVGPPLARPTPRCLVGPVLLRSMTQEGRDMGEGEQGRTVTGRRDRLPCRASGEGSDEIRSRPVYTQPVPLQ